MSKIKTKYHGNIEYKDSEIIIFEKGLPGFENLKKFIVFPVEENEMFNILHSIDDEDVGFTVISPFYVLKDYEFKVSKEKQKQLKINSYSEVLVLCTVTLNSNLKDITTNLQAPIIINIKEKLGEQIILNDDRYSIKYPLFKEDCKDACDN